MAYTAMFGVNLQEKLAALQKQRSARVSSQRGSFPRQTMPRDAGVFFQQLSDRFGEFSTTNRRVRSAIIRYKHGQLDILRLYVTVFLAFRESEQPGWFCRFEQFLPPSWQAPSLDWLKHAMITVLLETTTGDSQLKIGHLALPEPLSLSTLMAECQLSSEYINGHPSQASATLTNSDALSQIHWHPYNAVAPVPPCMSTILSGLGKMRLPQAQPGRYNPQVPLHLSRPAVRPIYNAQSEHLKFSTGALPYQRDPHVTFSASLSPTYHAPPIAPLTSDPEQYRQIQHRRSTAFASARAHNPMPVEVKVVPARCKIGCTQQTSPVPVATAPGRLYPGKSYSAGSANHSSAIDRANVPSQLLQPSVLPRAQSVASPSQLVTSARAQESLRPSSLTPAIEVGIKEQPEHPVQVTEDIRSGDVELPQSDTAAIWSGHQAPTPRQLRPRPSTDQNSLVQAEPIKQHSVRPVKRARDSDTKVSSTKKRRLTKKGTAVPALEGDEVRMLGLGLRSRR